MRVLSFFFAAALSSLAFAAAPLYPQPLFGPGEQAVPAFLGSPAATAQAHWALAVTHHFSTLQGADRLAEVAVAILATDAARQHPAWGYLVSTLPADVQTTVLSEERCVSHEEWPALVAALPNTHVFRFLRQPFVLQRSDWGAIFAQAVRNLQGPWPGRLDDPKNWLAVEALGERSVRMDVLLLLTNPVIMRHAQYRAFLRLVQWRGTDDVVVDAVLRVLRRKKAMHPLVAVLQKGAALTGAAWAAHFDALEIPLLEGCGLRLDAVPHAQ